MLAALARGLTDAGDGCIMRRRSPVGACAARALATAVLLLAGCWLSAQSAGLPWPDALPESARRLGSMMLRKPGMPSSLTYSPDSSVLWSEAFGPQNTFGRQITVGWRLADETRLRLFGADIAIVGAPVFSKDGRRVAVRMQREPGVVCFDAATGERLFGVDASTSKIDCFALSPSGRHLAFGSSKQKHRGPDFSRYRHSVVLWEVGGEQPLMHERLPGKEDRVHAIAFSADGSLLATLSTDGGGTLRVFDVGAKKRTHELAVAHVEQIRFDGGNVHVGWQGSLDTTTGAWQARAALPIPIASPYALSHDGRFLASVSDSPNGSGKKGRVAILDLRQNQVHAHLDGHTRRIESIAFSPDGKELVTGASDGRTLRWDVATGRVIEPTRGHWATIQGVAFDPKGRWLATCDEAGEMIVWDVQTGQVVRQLPADALALHHLSVSRDGHTVAVAATIETSPTTAPRHVVRLLDAATWQVRSELPDLGPFDRLWISAGGSRLVGTISNHGYLFDLVKDRQEEFLAGVVYPTANAIEMRTIERTILRDADSDRQLGDEGPARLPNAWDRTLDGLVVVGGSFDSVQVRDRDAYHVIDPLPDTICVTAARFAPDGARLAVATSNGELRVYAREAVSGQFRKTASFRDPTGFLRCLAFSPDGKQVATGGAAGSVVIWTLP